MRRHHMGAAVVAGAVLLAVVVPNIGGRSVPGRPQAIETLRTPAVGDCLLTPAIIEQDPYYGDLGIIADVGTQIGPCEGPRYGEVAAVVNTDGYYTSANSTGRVNLADDGGSLSYLCSDLTKDYQGMPKSLWGTFGDRWTPSIWTSSVGMQPDAEQQAAGQTWTACLTSPPFRTNDLHTYSTPLRDVFITGTPPSGLGQCEDVADIDAARPVPCDQPHQVENFGEASNLFARTDPAGDKLKNTCRQMVTVLTRLPDPDTGLGEDLQASVDLIHSDVAGGKVRGGPVTDQLTQQPGARCRVVTPPERTLSGSLVGLGDRPVPWT